MVKEELLISVVVPVYNVEKYLDRCINSLITQKYKKIEIILVDDGSLDSCPKMCDEWQKKDNRIRVIHKKNQGLGMARNTGMENAKGNYICFVDSDDILDSNAIFECYQKVKKYRYNILFFGFKYIDIYDKILKQYVPTPNKFEYFNQEVRIEFLPNIINVMPNQRDFNMNFSSCMCLIDMNLIRECGWKFVSEREIISEDVYSLLLLFKNIKSVCVIPKCFYSYRINYSSLTHSYRDDRYRCVKDFYIKSRKVYNEDYVNERIDYLFLSYSIGCIKSVVNSDLKYRQKLKRIKEIINDDLLRWIIVCYYKRESFIRKIYFLFVRLKSVNIVYFLTLLQNKKVVR